MNLGRKGSEIEGRRKKFRRGRVNECATLARAKLELKINRKQEQQAMHVTEFTDCNHSASLLVERYFAVLLIEVHAPLHPDHFNPPNYLIHISEFPLPPFGAATLQMYRSYNLGKRNLR